jgi:hypothetical protein
MTTGPTIRLDRPGAIDSYLEELRPRFIEMGYSWERDVVFEELALRCVALQNSTEEFQLSWMPRMFIFRPMSAPTLSLINEYMNLCMRYSRKRFNVFKSPPLRLVPVLVADQLSNQVAGEIQEMLPQPYIAQSVSAIAVVFDSSTRRLVYTRRTRVLHFVAWRPMQHLIETMLAP